MNVFFFGLGFSSLAAVEQFRQLEPGVRISGTVRSPEKAQLLRERGIHAHLFTGTSPSPDLSADLRATTHLVLSIAPDGGGDPALQQHRADLDAATGLQWLCYYSTVGVYGDFGGEWIDEGAPLVPRNERSDRRVAAEAGWRNYAEGRELPLAILRLAGIYGPGRSTFDKLRNGTARRLVKPAQVFNRIHVDDIGRITALAGRQRLAGTFNLGDDEPAPPQDLVAYAADLLGIAPPPAIPYAEAELTPMQRSFYADNKRVANGAIKAALGIELLHPNYREGLRAILAGEGS
ncbi:MAG: NAD(P)-dependent oxidoreductase [Devosia sp.]|nr:NAD(P)-dependent oxidoreductase [Devosia sp.]